jgi:cell division protein FtsB
MDYTQLLRRAQRYVTLNNGVLFAAGIIVIASIWNTMLTLQKNFILQQRVNTLEQQIKITQLEVDTLRLQQQYLRSPEYQELMARAKLGKATPGEQVINLPALPDDPAPTTSARQTAELSNVDKWMRFFFGR